MKKCLILSFLWISTLTNLLHAQEATKTAVLMQTSTNLALEARSNFSKAVLVLNKMVGQFVILLVIKIMQNYLVLTLKAGLNNI